MNIRSESVLQFLRRNTIELVVRVAYVQAGVLRDGSEWRWLHIHQSKRHVESDER